MRHINQHSRHSGRIRPGDMLVVCTENYKGSYLYQKTEEDPNRTIDGVPALRPFGRKLHEDDFAVKFVNDRKTSIHVVRLDGHGDVYMIDHTWEKIPVRNYTMFKVTPSQLDELLRTNAVAGESEGNVIIDTVDYRENEEKTSLDAMIEKSESLGADIIHFHL